MNKKLLWIPAVYALIMGILLVATIGFSYTPIPYDHTIEDNTWTVTYKGETWEVSAEEHVNQALQASLANNREHDQWNQDIVLIGALLPFVLFALHKEHRPFRNKVPYGAYIGFTLGLVVLYGIFSISTHMDIHAELKETIDYLWEVS
ncbi:hypothetical protein [Salimicrobium halophilum]|uniref:Uncharacterized protein n=1 Tax=Salimicrobium halophilum TaxID=86666 RepID=A0A1G8WA82_9BACI|nr:hypothetical protein [Salimicrobium halophilum]SDJ75076.1 hypothetical protein SAMN04490247_3089 [Salimicrobium halophilum]